MKKLKPILNLKKRVPRLTKFYNEHLKHYALLIGISSLFWLLFRSMGKPSRLQYPCQKAALNNVIVLLGPSISGGMYKLIDLKAKIHPTTVLRILIIVPVFMVSTITADLVHNYYQSIRKSEKMAGANESGPIGISMGKVSVTGLPIYSTSPFALANLAAPNDVISVHDSQATNWDYSTNYFWQYVNQDIVDTMIAMGVMYLTGTNNTNDAWNALIPYQAGESVVIKFNFNNSGCTTENNKIEPLAETANAIIDDLTAIGVPGNKIWIADPSRNIPERFRNMIKNPDIQYYGRSDCEGIPNYHTVTHVDPSSPAASIATCPEGEKILPFQVFVDANHLINVPKFLSHGSYVTLALKNHYGSVLYENFDRTTMHAYFNESGNSRGCNLDSANILADINNNPHIRDKTRLIIGEGLFGNQYSNRGDARRWDIFGNGSPNMYFFSTDPISISSVMTDYLMAERGWQSHQQLHAGAYLGLGVHEHWDNFENKNYSSFNYLIIDRDNPDSIPPLNHPPVAMNDSVNTSEDSLVIIDVLVNDHDPDGFIDSSTVTIVNNPSNGNISNIDPVSGTVTYEPKSGFHGVDTFTYTIDDNSAVTSNVAIVMVNTMLSTNISENEYFVLPSEFFLGQNYPNPFNSSTKIIYSISHADFVILKIYNMHGQEIQTLVNEFKRAGNHTIVFDAKNFSSGIYHYKLQVGSNVTETKKMMLMQ
jgi:hypothetical protein